MNIKISYPQVEQESLKSVYPAVFWHCSTVNTAFQRGFKVETQHPCFVMLSH